jgi:uncharacterized protein YfiM (DUF2279 family)
MISNSFRSLAFFLLIVINASSLFAQRTDTTQHLSKKKLNLLIVSSSVAYTGTMIGLNQAWYKNADRQSFHFFNDAREWNQVDKLGHFYSAFQLSSIAAHSLRWTGINKKKSDNIGSASGFAILSSIEVFDGYSAAYGASLSDIAANATGSLFYLGQQKLWNEVRIYPKFSFHTTDFAAQRPSVLGTGFSQQLLKDYNGQTYWLSVDADKFVKFPRWLNLAVGYGTEEMIYANASANHSVNLAPYRQYYLSIDFDLTAIKSKSKFVNALIYFANMIKLPAPTLALSKRGVRAHAFYF